MQINKLITLIIVIVFSSCATQKQLTAKKDKDGHLVGIATKENFKQEPYGSDWFNDFYSYYEPEKPIVDSLKTALKNVTVKGFMGTWCGDSKREVPNFYKILDATGFDYSNLEFITVNRKKQAFGLEKGHDILRVPTFIFYKKGKEIGRFVEHTVNEKTLEHDILQILLEKGYKHAYQK